MTRSFVLPAAGNGTPQSTNRKRLMAEAMLAQSMGYEPIASPWQGANKLAQALMGGLIGMRADKMDAQGREGANNALIRALTGDRGVAPSQADPTGAMVQGINDPYQSDIGQRMLYDKWQQDNAPPAQPKFENVGGRLVRINPDNTIEEAYAPPEKPAPLPAGVQEYEYAKKQGFKGSFQDWKASLKGNMEIRDPVTGNVIYSSGNMKPLTEGQSKDTVYATRARGALKEFEPKANAMTGLKDSLVSDIPVAGNYLKSDDYQQAEQSGREFLASILRKDTGAAVTPDEVTLYGAIYFPRPGDGPEVLAQKKASRERAVAAIEAGMPPQAILAQERTLNAEKVPPVPSPDLGTVSPPTIGGQNSAGQPMQTPPPEAISELMADPSPQAAAEFDAVFGQGAAARIMQGVR